MEFHWRAGVWVHRVVGKQGGAELITGAVGKAGGLLRQRREEVVEEAEQLESASEVVLEVDDGAFRPVFPVRLVALKQLRRGAAEAVDALFFIADEEQVGGVFLPAKGAEDGVLGLGDVLIFVGKDVFESRLHFAGDCGFSVAVGAAEEVERELFHIVEVERFLLFFAFAESFLEVFGELKEGEDLPAALFPVLEQRRQAGLIFFFVQKQRFKKERVLEKFLEWFAGAGFLALGPGLIGGGNVAEAIGGGVWVVWRGKSGAQGFQRVDA